MELAPTNNSGTAEASQERALATTDGQEMILSESGPDTPVTQVLQTWRAMGWGRRIGLMALVAMTFAVLIAVLLWASAPEYKPLFIDLGDTQAGEILDALDRMQAKYKIDRRRGTILVPAEDVHELRLRLAAQGLPRKEDSGYEILEKEPGFGTSRAIEKARFQHALEGEIARSIMILQGVKGARVHLALPKQSVFVRQRKPPAASVLLQLAPGYDLDRQQVRAIIHLVSSSVPRLEPERVTVVDQYGHLLSAQTQDNDELSLTGKQFEYKKRVEDHLAGRIETLLIPMVGRDALRAQVSADIDFTAVERTEELYNPDLPALRSEQREEQSGQNQLAQGVPGALSNQPPAAGTAPEVGTKADSNGSAGPVMEARKKVVRNFELDRTINHINQAKGEIRRLTVAVAVDNATVPQPDGTVVRRPYTQEELNNLTALVKQAVGFDASRGDRITVSNIAFHGEEDLAPAPLPLWQQPWVWSLGKQGAALLTILILIFAVLRPMMRTLLPKTEPPQVDAETAGEGADIDGADEGGGQNEEDLSLEQESEELLLLEGPQGYEKRLEFVRRLIDEDPDRVVQVIKNWIEEDAAG